MVEQLDIFETSQQEERHSDLTPRQWAMYRLIYHNSLVEHRKTSQREIYEKVNGYEWNSDEKAHDNCPAIWNDITTNNLSMEHEHIIISKNFEYWVGSQSENEQYLKSLWKALAPRLTRYWNYAKKLKLDGQGKLLDKNNNPINEDSRARAFFEAFNDYNITMQKEEK